MTIEDEKSLNGEGKKRNPFRRKRNGGRSEHGSEGSSANSGKLRWAQHLGHRDRASSEDGSKESPRNHPWKVPAAKKLHWSPRPGHNKSHDGSNEEHAAVEGESRDIASRMHPWNENTKNNLGLHWSPRPGHKSREAEAVGDDASSENGVSREVHAAIPRQVGAGSPLHGRNSEFSDSISDDISSEASSKKETVADRIHRIRRKLNPRGKVAHWRYRIGEHRIDEDEEHHLPLGSELDPLEGFYQHSLAGDLEMPDGTVLVPSPDKRLSPNRIRSSTEPIMDVRELTEHPFRRTYSLERNTSPQSLRSRGEESYDTDIIGPRGGRTSSTSSVVSSDVASNRHDSDVVSLGASSINMVPSMVHEESPIHAHRKGAENKEYRVKPYHCFETPEYMTESEIHQLMLQPSHNVEFLESFIAPSSNKTRKIEVSGEIERIWGTTDDGRVGSLRVEVLGCIGLASVKPDVSAYLICGDVPFVTDVINSCRSPVWPPNSKRAVVFPVHHAYARLFAGIFASTKDKANDEFCGRVALDIASLRPNTEYDVTLPLRASSFIYDRRPRGVLRLRFSLHWFSERAAVMSYLKSPHSLAATPFGDNPSVLCGDPKTFRNVAITVHGQDLPGKFTRKAFQATMREFNLTRLNLIFLAKTIATEAVLYEKPLVSLYLFITWMHCVYLDSVKLAPAYFIGYLILCLFNNYETFNQDQTRDLGYRPPTLQELLYSMISRGDQDNMQPLLVAKKVVNSQPNLFERQQSISVHGYSQDFSGDIEPLDHREFPFSEKLEYPRFRPEDAIAPTKHTKNTAPDQYLYGRLSMYASDKMSNLQSAIPAVTAGGSNEGDEWELSDNEEEEDLDDSDHMRGDRDNLFMESDDEEDEEEELNRLTSTGVPIVQQKRIPIGPPQNCDVKPLKRVPPQVVLARAENTLHSLTFGLSMDKLFHSSLAVGKRISSGFASPDCSTRDEASETNTKSIRKKRSLLDDFDKRLGLRTRSKNPVVEITSSFLGPIMRIFRIFLVATRVVFNIGVWRDPFLSFWVLCFLLALMLILLVFPWRCFMFLTGLVCFGPQNILVRRRLLYKAAEAKKEEEKEAGEEGLDTSSIKDEDSITVPSEEAPSVDSEASSDGTPGSTSETAALDASTADEAPQKKAGRRRRIKNKLAKMREKRRIKKQESLERESARPLPPRPAFCAATYHRASKVLLEPREVVVPYTRVRTERFYDWPPDPTVSQASPVFLADYGLVEEAFVPSPGETGSTPRGLSRRRLSSEL